MEVGEGFVCHKVAGPLHYQVCSCAGLKPSLFCNGIALHEGR